LLPFLVCYILDSFVARLIQLRLRVAIVTFTVVTRCVGFALRCCYARLDCYLVALLPRFLPLPRALYVLHCVLLLRAFTLVYVYVTVVHLRSVRFDLVGCAHCSLLPVLPVPALLRCLRRGCVRLRYSLRSDFTTIITVVWFTLLPALPALLRTFDLRYGYVVTLHVVYFVVSGYVWLRACCLRSRVFEHTTPLLRR